MAGAGARAEIMDKGGAGAENKKFRLRNTAVPLCDNCGLEKKKLTSTGIC